jgi:hypothetical protein
MVAIGALVVAAAAGAGMWQAKRFMATPVNLPDEGMLFEI